MPGRAGFYLATAPKAYFVSASKDEYVQEEDGRGIDPTVQNALYVDARNFFKDGVTLVLMPN